MSDVQGALGRVESGLHRLGRERVFDVLRPGAPPGHVRDLLRSCGLPNNPQVEEVYRWRNGTNTSTGKTLDVIQVFPGFYLLSVEDAVANYRAFVGDPRWMPGWLPIFANGGGDFYVVDLTGEVPGSVRHFWIDEREHPIEFESVEVMLQTLAAAFDEEVFFIDPGGYLEMDDLVFAALAARMNPRVPWWTE